MGVRHSPEMIQAAFDLYLKYNGERFDLIEKEMQGDGWSGFKTSLLLNRGRGKNFREGWIERFRWKKSLEIKIAMAGVVAQTSAESLLFEVETIRKKLFITLEANGVNSKDLVYQHDKYVGRSTEILAQLDKARDNHANFVFFLTHLLKAAPAISPALAEALFDAEDGLLDWAEREFVTNEDSDNA